MNAMKLTDKVAVSGQISPTQVASIASQGFRVIVNNRPDGEDPGQPDSCLLYTSDAADDEYNG